MKYKTSEITLKELIKQIDDESIDLSPSYQRNFIWSKSDQTSLIDSIYSGYPLPNIFIFNRRDGKSEMVDGQQRSRTIYRYFYNKFSKGDKLYFKDTDENKFLEYKLPVVFLFDIEENDSLNDFYVLINKRGKVLNSAETDKAEYSDSPFLKLANEALNYQPLIDLEIFSEATSKRMNDRMFIQELLAYLTYGITDKKSGINKAYEDDALIELKYDVFLKSFKMVIDKISHFEKHKKLSKTRYRQKNDFYTLFNLFDLNSELSNELLDNIFKVLILLNRKDKNGEQFISPSNDNCETLREYAINCVSQSNSKKARELRLEILTNILLNKSKELNDQFEEVLEYLGDLFGSENVLLMNIDEYVVLNIDEI